MAIGLESRVRVAEVNSVHPAMVGRAATVAAVGRKGKVWLIFDGHRPGDVIAGPYRADELDEI